ncbi:MAG TPA: NUDIX hydrolase, partial [Gammaproteobacteria bacterium]|nr:NUDIX hydrolase [Gammaproteobacteria bacterium]
NRDGRPDYAGFDAAQRGPHCVAARPVPRRLMQNTRNPWTTLTTRVVYDNAWIRVEEHEVINPSGGRNRYGKVCFKNLAVGIIALDAHDHIYLVGQHRYTLDEYSWELPMGGAPRGEAPRDAAERELREETGLTARRWRELMKVHTSNSVTDEVGVVYVAEDLSEGEQELEETEDLAVKRLPFAEAYRWAVEGRITDAISLAGIFRLAAERGMSGLSPEPGSERHGTGRQDGTAADERA